MATLKLKSIQCIETEDNWGADDAYIKVNGELVWGPNKINDGQSQIINKDITFVNSASIELFDKDDADPDDHLGTNIAWASEIGQGEKTVFFNADDCNYRLVYLITN